MTTELETKPLTGKEYNGWSNHETWQANLWIDNEGYAGGSDGVAEQAADFVGTELNHDSESALEAAIESLAEWIRERLEDDLKLEEAKGLAYDILWSWFGEVNWREIASHYCEEAQSAAVAQEEE